MNCQRPLDLDRYRRMKEKQGRLSTSPRVSLCSPFSPGLETSAEQRSKHPAEISYREAPPTPDPKFTSRFACGVLASNEKPTKQPSPVSLIDEARRRRFDKFRSRTTRQSESPKPRIEVNLRDTLGSPSNSTISSRKSMFAERPVEVANIRNASPMNRTERATVRNASPITSSGRPIVRSASPMRRNDRYAARSASPMRRDVSNAAPSGRTERATSRSASRARNPEGRLVVRSASPMTRKGANAANNLEKQTKIQQEASVRNASPMTRKGANATNNPEKQTKIQQEASVRNASPMTRKVASATKNPEKQTENQQEAYPRLTESATIGKSSRMRRPETSATKRKPIDPPENNIVDPPDYISDAPWSGSLQEPIVVEDTKNAVSEPRPPSLYCSSSRGIPPPNPPGQALISMSSVGSSSTARRDRIEDLRAIEDDREPLAEIQSPPGLDRIESTRDNESVEMRHNLERRHSLEMPSLHSRYSSEMSSRYSLKEKIYPSGEMHRLDDSPKHGSKLKEANEKKIYSSGEMHRLDDSPNYGSKLKEAASDPSNDINYRDSPIHGSQLKEAASDPSNVINCLDSPNLESHSKEMISEPTHWTEKFRSFRYSSDMTRRTLEGKLLGWDSAKHGTPLKEVAGDPTNDINRRGSSENENQLKERASDPPASLTKDFQSFRSEAPNKPVQIYRIESPSPAEPTLDQGTVRLLYSKDFTELINHHRSHQTTELFSENQDENELPRQPGRHGVSFVVRKRPISETEQARGEFDVVNAETGLSNALVVYRTKLLPDLKTKDLEALPVRCDAVFSEHRPSEEFYIRVGQPLVLAAKNGEFATFVIYGSSGSGKTHTMTDIEERAVYDIFESAGSPRSNPSGKSTHVSVQYVELSGSQCFDLLGPVGRFVRVVDKEGGYFRFKGALAKTASNARELLTILSDAKRRFATQATIRKHSEGQSYLLCQITIRQAGRDGCLTLLECATGPEHNRHMDPPGDASEATSFDVLFECIRSRASGRMVTNPLQTKYNVTKIIQESLESEGSGVCVVATISPNATGTEYTLSTLASLTKIMSGYPEHDEEPLETSPSNDETGSEDLVLPRQWSHSELVSWMAKKRMLVNPVPPDVNGRFAMRMSKMQLKNTFYDVLDDAKAERLFVTLRAENDRIARIRVKRRLALKKEVA